MTEIKQNGLVLKERDIAENDKLLLILTERYGKLPVIAKGAKSVKNRHMPSCQLFSYASFCLRRRGNYYYITDSDLIENYYDIRNDVTKFSLASFVCDVVEDVTQEGNNDDEILRLALNTLYAIAKDIKPLEIIRASFELRIASELGFSPDIECCSLCKELRDTNYYFDIIDASITCERCKNSVSLFDPTSPFLDRGISKPVTIIPLPIIKAIQYIINSKIERFLSFSLGQEHWTAFFETAEKYLLNHLERGFYSLDFYKTLL